MGLPAMLRGIDSGFRFRRSPVLVVVSAWVKWSLGKGSRQAWGSMGSQRSWVAASATVPAGPSTCWGPRGPPDSPWPAAMGAARPSNATETAATSPARTGLGTRKARMGPSSLSAPGLPARTAPQGTRWTNRRSGQGRGRAERRGREMGAALWLIVAIVVLAAVVAGVIAE